LSLSFPTFQRLETRKSALGDDLSSRGGRPTTAYSPGDRIEIGSGTLAGLKGYVALIRDAERSLVTIDGWPEGSYLMVSNHSLVLLGAGPGASNCK
jgi:hypothetical protein